VIVLMGWAISGLFELEPVDRQDFRGVAESARSWHAMERTNLLNWQLRESTNLLTKDQAVQMVISDLQSRFEAELKGLEETPLKNDWAQPGSYKIYEEYLSIATNMEFSVRSMHSKLTNYADRRGSPELARADYGDFQKSSRDLKNWSVKQRSRPDAEWLKARSLEFKERFGRQPASGTNALVGITYDLGGLLDELDNIHKKYLAEAKVLTNKISDQLFVARLNSAGQEAENMLELARQSRRDGESVLAFLDAQWKSAVQQRTEALKLPLVSGRKHLELLALLHTNTPPPTIGYMPITTAIDQALKQRPNFSAYSQALYPLIVAQIGLFVFLLVALYRRLVVERLRLRLYESNTENKLAHLSQLAAWLAHEIKQPLTAINAWLWTLQKRVKKEMPEHMGTTAIRKEINRLDRIVKDFLRFTQPAAPKLVPVKAEPVLREVLELLGPQLERKCIRLSLDSRVDASFAADPQQLKQVLINLISNAAESIKHEGSIIVRTRRDNAPLNGRPADAILIEVEDTGTGIAPEVQERLFDPFFSTKDEGTGLGLPIARKIIDAHGGALEFKTALDEGTTFRIVLPLARDARLKT
jgi:signal transduction histidine kinase